jgi:hypothetical protein
MRAKEAFQIMLAFGFVSVPLTLVARSPQAVHSQAGSTSSGNNSASNSTSPAPTPSDASSADLNDFAWLEGRWRGEWGPRVAEQVWLSPKAGAMEGMFRLVEADKTLVIEFFTLVQKPNGISFYFRHFTPNLAPWEKSDATILNLATIENKSFIFENPVNGMPKSAALTRIDSDTYISRSEIVPETGDSQVIEITYKRQPVASPLTSGGSGAHQKKP